MGTATVLLIGHVRAKDDYYVEALRKRYQLLVATSGKQGMTCAEKEQPEAIVLDAASMRTPGERVCKTLRKEFPTVPLLHIHPGPDHNVDSPADVLFIAPFTSRKLINSLERLIHADADQIIQCGPFAMNVPQRLFIANGQETQLTPKLALLMELFLRHPNQTIDRPKLMEAIWQTDYLGDTRTLDVHIRWMRRALEDAGMPHGCLTTVRGIGYRLEVPEFAPALNQKADQLVGVPG